MNAGFWYNQVTTEAELKITNNDKIETLQAATSLELSVSQKWEKENHMAITLPMGENPSYEPLSVELEKNS